MRNLILRRLLPHKLTLWVQGRILWMCALLLLAYPCALAHVGSEVDPRVREALSILTEALQDTAEEVYALRQDVNSLGEAVNQLQEQYAELAAALVLFMSHYALALDERSTTDRSLVLLLGDLMAALNDDDE